MRYRSACAVAFLSLLTTTACTQPAAQVDLKGHYVFSKNGQQESPQSGFAPAPQFSSYSTPTSRTSYSSSSYANESYVSAPTQQTASVSSIGVSDLAPPQKDSVWASKTTQPESQDTWNTVSVKENTQPEQWRPAADSVASKPVELKSEIDNAKGSAVDLITTPRKSSFIWPVNSNKVLSSYGPKGSGKANDGMNISASEGEPVWAVADGEVIFVGDELAGYGNMVLIKHAGSNTTTYAHLNQATVDKYDRVKQGDIIGYVGSTGNVKSPQLYFAVRDGKENVDPQKFLNRNVAGL